MSRRRPSPEVEEILADLSLAALDVHSTALHVHPVVREVAKALMVAQLHPDIEARVICRTIEDLVEALLILGGKSAAGLGGKWSILDRTLELPNGSAVVVMVASRETRP